MINLKSGALVAPAQISGASDYMSFLGLVTYVRCSIFHVSASRCSSN